MTSRLSTPTTTFPTSSSPASRAEPATTGTASEGPASLLGSSPRIWTITNLIRALTAIIVLGGIAYGVVLRLWLLDHLAFQSDEAVVGLMGRQILAGHTSAFYWGSFYGGIEAYVVAPAMWVFGSTATVVNATPAVLAGVAAVLVGLTVRVAGGGRKLAALAATLVWVWPYAAVFNSVRELGLRAVAMVCGLALILLALLVYRGHRQLVVFVGLGLAAGLGWWASPEIVYFLLPTAVLLVVSWDRLMVARARRSRWRPLPVVVAVAGGVIGALPWLVANIRSGFTSLHSGALGSSGTDYAARLRDFFAHVLPTQLGLQGVPDGRWVGGRTVGPVLFGVVLALVVAALAGAVREVLLRRRAAAPVGAAGLAVVAFPFLYAVFPNSGYWADGRYGVYLPPLVALLLALVVARVGSAPARQGHSGAHASARTAGVGALATVLGVLAPVAVVGAGALTVGAARTQGVPASPSTFFSGWARDNPNIVAARAADQLEQAGIRHAFATYWVAYVVDFLTHQRVVVTPTLADEPRNSTIYYEVANAAHPAAAYLFYAPEHQRADTLAFANAEPGPAGETESLFTTRLRRQGVGFRVVHAGLLDAVVPSRPVTLPVP